MNDILHTLQSRRPLWHAVGAGFLGRAPRWYKTTIVACLLVNPLLLHVAGPFVTGWCVMAQFLFTLAMALTCYPLQPGGLIALEAVVLGLTQPTRVYAEVADNLPVLLLLMFMVAGVYFLRDLLFFLFSRLFVHVRSKTLLSLLFCGVAAGLSAFLDALTVMAVIMMVVAGLWALREQVGPEAPETRDALRRFSHTILMHGAIGTVLGGVLTMVGEPQNLLIAHVMGWDFGEFFARMLPVTLPVLIAGLLVCWALERFRLCGYGAPFPDAVRVELARHLTAQGLALDMAPRVRLGIQAAGGVLLVAALALHVAEVGLVGLALIILLTAFNGVTEERHLAPAFHEAMPFVALLGTFFAMVAMIHDQHLFAPIVRWTLAQDGRGQVLAFYGASGLLSAISDNVFVALVYMTQAKEAFQSGLLSGDQYRLAAVAINTGTNIPSIATPNGQAAFLFLLTSSLAARIGLSYMTMVKLALPYTVVLTLTGLLAAAVWL